VRWLLVVLGVQLLVAGAFIALASSGALDGSADSPRPRRASDVASRVDRFDGRAAFGLLEEQLQIGPRPAGSEASRALAARLRRLLPHGRYQAVPGGLRNVVGSVPGREPSRVVVVGAHYDTKDVPSFVGANDGASGTAVLTQLARTLKPWQARPTVVFVALDGEESPRGTPDSQFVEKGLRGSRVAARAYRRADAMILLDFVGNRDLSIPREADSDPGLWAKLRSAARHTGNGAFFPPKTGAPIEDDHLPFRALGVPAIDLIDFDYPCFHLPCDDISHVSARSLDVTGETVLQLLRTL
jgi:peptidase M28-like protein